MQHLLSDNQIDMVLTLTERQHEVFKLLGEGFTTSEIGARTTNVLNEKTVSTHIAHIKDKLGIDNINVLRNHALRYKIYCEQNNLSWQPIDLKVRNLKRATLCTIAK